jgi:hypothetical protein
MEYKYSAHNSKYECIASDEFDGNVEEILDLIRVPESASIAILAPIDDSDDYYIWKPGLGWKHHTGYSSRIM